MNITAASAFVSSRTLISASYMPGETIFFVFMGPSVVGIVILPVCVVLDASPVAVNVYALSAECICACAWGMWVGCAAISIRKRS